VAILTNYGNLEGLSMDLPDCSFPWKAIWKVFLWTSRLANSHQPRRTTLFLLSKMFICSSLHPTSSIPYTAIIDGNFSQLEETSVGC